MTERERERASEAKEAAREAVAFLDRHRARLDRRFWVARPNGLIRAESERGAICPLSACADEGVVSAECEPEEAFRELPLSLDAARLITGAADARCLYDYCDERGLDNPESWRVDAFERVRKALEGRLRGLRPDRPRSAVSQSGNR